VADDQVDAFALQRLTRTIDAFGILSDKPDDQLVGLTIGRETREDVSAWLWLEALGFTHTRHRRTRHQPRQVAARRHR